MSVVIVAGGNYGSEGKGKVARYLCQQKEAGAAVRVGGPNSGHTVSGKVVRMLPSIAVDKDPGRYLILPAGSYIDVRVLLEEIELYDIPPKLVKIHPNAGVITEEQKGAEAILGLGDRISSTLSGTGACVADRVMRSESFMRAKDCVALKPFITDTTELMNLLLQVGEMIVVEGSQGYMLSNLVSPYYPYATARDTTAAGILSEAGLSPFDVETICLVFRTFPIRVGGPSGELPREISWDDVSRCSGVQNLREYTSVTHKLRRVAEFDFDDATKAIMANKPNMIVINHMDYLKEDARRVFLKTFERMTGRGVDLAGIGPDEFIEAGELM